MTNGQNASLLNNIMYFVKGGQNPLSQEHSSIRAKMGYIDAKACYPYAPSAALK